ncbi:MULTISPECIES: hypothetical protein [unclassified Candidatus Nanosynbacter]|jgi:hypothetical protein cdivTM_06052|uniref:hypothetical protein n=1 Tax=unclassified Candidatus Nanosynbacter TaxID=2725944 RepID=UPI001FB5BBF8|nr:MULTISPECIES: hypothetical protein [unclassified Candidatus Nanosynbacter]MCJ1963345.1 hypothetical protein [Candidatus Nanosynbacter sp. TM7-033]UOG67833.1 hypothetical protein LRM46_03460 [Candidatus Nanosynbacter sp. HMT-352]
MSKWEDRIQNSATYTAAKKLLTRFDEVDLGNVSLEAIDDINRAKLVIELLIDRLNNTDDRLISISNLDNINNYLSGVSSCFDNWQNYRNDAYLDISYMNGYIDNILSYIPSLTPAMDIKETRKAIAGLNRSVGQYKRVAAKEINSISAKGAASEKTIDEKVTEAKNEFETLGAKVAELNKDLKDIKDSSNKISAEQQLSFTKSENVRNEMVNKFIEEQKRTIEETFSKKSNEADRITDDIDKKLNATEAKAEDSLARIDELLNIAGDKTLIHDYSSSAKEDMEAADKWRKITTLLLFVVLIFSFWVVCEVIDTKDVSWQLLVARAFVMLFAGGVAGYTATQSSEHRKAQRANQRTAHQLKALKPYLLSIEGDVKLRNEIIKTVAYRIFNNEENNQVKKSKGLFKSKEEAPIMSSQLIELLLDLAKKIPVK